MLALACHAQCLPGLATRRAGPGAESRVQVGCKRAQMPATLQAVEAESAAAAGAGAHRRGGGGRGLRLLALQERALLGAELGHVHDHSLHAHAGLRAGVDGGGGRVSVTHAGGRAGARGAPPAGARARPGCARSKCTGSGKSSCQVRIRCGLCIGCGSRRERPAGACTGLHAPPAACKRPQTQSRSRDAPARGGRRWRGAPERPGS